MKIAVINETSAADKNRDILAALEDSGHEILNIGMREKGASPELQYNHTGFLAALALNSGRADFVVGGCGTGQGFLNAALQYPGLFCGLVRSPLDAWLFTQINGGNCLSLALNEGYGWAGDVNLRFIFQRIFSVERGGGYPPERKEPQQASRKKLEEISRKTHTPFAEIVAHMPGDIADAVLAYPGVLDFLDPPSLAEGPLKTILMTRRGA